MRQFEQKVLFGGIGTINASRSPMLVGEGDIIDGDNLTYERDTWEKFGGAQKINTTAITGNPSITGYHEFESDAGVKELVVSTSAGNLHTIGTGGIVKTIATGIGATRVGVFAEGSTGGNKRLFFVNGNTPMLMYDGGASAVAIGNPALDWASKPPTWVVSHNGRLWAGNDTHFLYGSKLNTHDDFINTGAVFFSCYPGEGSGLVGAISKWRRLFLFKYPLGVYYLDDTNADFNNWTTQRHGRNVGSFGHRSILEAVDDVLFASPEGYIHALSAVQEYGDVKTSAILPVELGNIIRDEVDKSRPRQVQSIYHSTKRKAIWCFTRNGSSVNNFTVGLDFHNPGSVQAFLCRRDIGEALGLYTDPSTKKQYVVYGDNNGFIWRVETETFDKDGQPYSAYYETDDVEFYGRGNRRANFKELEVEFDQSGVWNLSVDVIVDGNLRETLSLSLQGAGAVLGAFVLGTDVLGLQSLQNVKGRLHGDGRRMRLKGYNNAVNESFRIVSHTIKYLPGNEK